ncbi:MAG: hypothetical protein Q8L69_03110 [Gallionellaceae bacterium]|nr:hypothetical protein [Gallionellaceae bacterium]
MSSPPIRIGLAARVLAGSLLALSAQFAFAENCRFNRPGVVVISPDGKEMVLLNSQLCRRGLFFPDFSGFSNGACLIPGTCSSNRKYWFWKADLGSGKVGATPLVDEHKMLCEEWPFSGKRGQVHAFSTAEPDATGEKNVPVEFNSCDLYSREANNSITKRQRIFGSEDFRRGLPAGWRYFVDAEGAHFRAPGGLAGIDLNNTRDDSEKWNTPTLVH